MIAQGVLVLALTHAILARVNTDFYGCKDHFYNEQPPEGFIGNLTAICQMYGDNNNSFFATLYDNTHRFGLYSAYIMDTSAAVGKRHDITFKVEPQLVNAEILKYSNRLNHDILNQYILNDFIPDYMMNQVDTQDRIIKLKEYLKKNNINIPDAADYLVRAVQAINSDYEGSGYDKGHLNPRAHHPYGAKQNATFTLTNVAPMDGHMNRLTWRTVENEVKNISANCGRMHVITGVAPNNTNWINGRVNIPSVVWSAYCCLDKYNMPIKAGGFWAQNEYTDDYDAEDDIIGFQKYLGELMNTTITLFDKNCR